MYKQDLHRNSEKIKDFKKTVNYKQKTLQFK